MTTSQEISIGYGFAYFAFIRSCQYRRDAASRGFTFFVLFNDLNGRLW